MAASVVLAAGISACTSHSASKPPQARHEAGRLTLFLALDHAAVVAGQELHGHAYVSNETGEAIPVNCGEWLSIGLANAHQSFPPPFSATGACRPQQTIPVGDSMVAVTIVTRYNECGGSLAQQGKAPPCGPDGSPALPRGQYQTYAVYDLLSGLKVAQPPAVQVRLT